MEGCFNKLKDIIARFDLQNKPQTIFHCDEIGIQRDAGIQKVLCKRGSRNPNKLVGSVTKAMYTVLMYCNAIGDFLPMFINYKGLHLYSTWCVGEPEKARYNCLQSGWIEAPQCLYWFINCFIPEILKLDGTKCDCRKNIEMFCLPAHTSHLVQPLDVGVYKAVKASWNGILRNYYNETGYKNVDKLVLPTLMKKISEYACLSRANTIGGFEGSGIYPLCKEKMTRKIEIAKIIEGEKIPVFPLPHPLQNQLEP
ncbi:hypothetical protein NQ314_012619 [Rhamnusium bicolor]|uniref:DDE-1 domain-containing protein n=1 Tax=Rhamnusium bicolor TaxID=1586634 RepID=A0AAV8XBK3_9CUCU|nr:hypothetical protein NQ314_012619 [Rhamnusium bicolor]